MRSRLWISVGVLAILFAGVVMYLSSNSAKTPATSSPQPTARHSPEVLRNLNQAITAQLHQNWSEARRLYLAVEQADPTCEGVEFQLGVVAFNTHDYAEARLRLNRSIDRKEQIPQCDNLLGVMLAEEKKPTEAIEYFKKATQANPRDPQGYSNWAEALRSMGQPKEAEQKLRQAIQCDPNDPLYAFERRLAVIEDGRESELTAELNRQMQLKPIAGDWLLTSAAIFLQHGRSEQAAISMDKARTAMAPTIFFAMIQDPIFVRHAQDPEIAPFYHVEISQTNPATQPSTTN